MEAHTRRDILAAWLLMFIVISSKAEFLCTPVLWINQKANFAYYMSAILLLLLLKLQEVKQLTANNRFWTLSQWSFTSEHLFLSGARI